MPKGKYIAIDANGDDQEISAVVVSTGVGSAGDIPAFDPNGRLDPSAMPLGVGSDTKAVIASEALIAGDFVNTYNNAGVLNMRKADATNGRRVDGFVKVAVAAAASGVMYLEGNNDALAALTPGAEYFLSATQPGKVTIVVAATTGHILQYVGTAMSATELNFEPDRPRTRA
jgi:hypothetical protein